MKGKFGWGIGLALTLYLVYHFTRPRSGAPSKSGALLAQVYCSSCHVYPDPQLLPKQVWTASVLPEMGLRLGIGDKYTVLDRMSLKLFDQLNRLGVYPDTSALSQQD